MRAIPEVLVTSRAVKIFTLNTALWDMSSSDREQLNEEEKWSCDDLPSFLPSIFPDPQPLLPSRLLPIR